ncbi:MAG TPA: 2-C-methyl-D-erythritol 4-phosphate cytidylyltransferase [Chloroflexota bacterium]|nr:2-C-methyl-D-erythritol 4-phosphate cytidylyltransferase [Chloroflexota bacterium]
MIEIAPPETPLAVIVVAAGSSTRMDGIDKIWAPLAGRPILAHSVLAMQEVGTELIVVVKQPDEVRVVQMLEGLHIRIPWRITRGGARRQDSVRCGLRAIRTGGYVAVHDAARPLATADLLARTFAAGRDTGAAIPGLSISDTIKRVTAGRVDETVNRNGLWAVQTPQVFSTELLIEAYRAAVGDDESATDDAMLVERSGRGVAVVEGEPWNFKVTTPRDLELAEALIRLRRAREDQAALSA